MRSYSMDLRERVAAACDEGIDTRAEIAERFSVSPAWIRRLLQRRRETGSLAPRPHRGGHPPAFDAEAAERLRDAVRANPDATLKELAQLTGVACSLSAVDRTLKRLRVSWKKKSPYAAEQDRPELKAEREAWRAEFATIDASRLVLLDETSTNTAMTRHFGRAPLGKRVRVAVPHGHWKATTLTAAVRLGGVGACLAFDGATNSACFQAYIAKCLVPTLKPGDIVIMDNLPSHKSAEVEQLVVSAGAQVRYLPAYSPDLNPIEEMFSKLKAFLRKVAARTSEGPIDAIGDGLRSIMTSDIIGWFGDTGYRYKQK